MNSKAKLIAEGHWGRVFDLGDSRVAKYFRADAHPMSIKLEAEVANVAFALGVPTPKPISFETEPEKGFIIFERVDGETLAQHILPRPWRIIWATKEMAKILAKTHSVQISGVHSVKSHFEERIQRATELTDVQKNKALEILSKLEDGDRLCHTDYHPGNVMVEGQICKVIDWGGATQGHPMADLTHTYVLNKVDGVLEEFSWAQRTLILAMRRLYVELFLLFYAKYSGYRYRQIKAEIKRWIIPVAAARLASYGDFETPALLKVLKKSNF